MGFNKISIHSIETKNILEPVQKKTVPLADYLYYINIYTEVNNYLSYIQNVLDKLSPDLPELSPENQHYFRLLSDKTLRFISFASKIKEYLSQREELLPYSTEDVNVSELLGNIHKVYSTIFSKVIKVFPDISSNHQVQARSNPTYLGIIIANIYENLVNLTAKDSAVKVNCMYSEEKNHFIIDFRIKNGKSLTNEQFILFENYFTSDRETYSLFLSKVLSKHFGGYIKLEKKGNEDYSIRLFMPVNQEFHEKKHETDTYPARAYRETSKIFYNGFEGKKHENDLSKQHRDYRILVVEDNPDLRKFLSESLKYRYIIEHASNGSEAIKLLKPEKFDLVITDYLMPGLDGITLCRTLKENPNTNHLPVILLTSRASVEHEIESYRTGADAYLAKPFRLNLLESLIDNLIHSRQLLKNKFFAEGLSGSKSNIIPSADEEFMRNVVEIIERNIEVSNYNLQNFESDIGMSRSVLYRKIMKLTGHSPYEFILHYRLERASRLLEKEGNTVSGVAYKVGFNDPKNFSKSFRKKFAMSPSEYKESKSCKRQEPLIKK